VEPACLAAIRVLDFLLRSALTDAQDDAVVLCDRSSLLALLRLLEVESLLPAERILCLLRPWGLIRPLRVGRRAPFPRRSLLHPLCHSRPAECIFPRRRHFRAAFDSQQASCILPTWHLEHASRPRSSSASVEAICCSERPFLPGTSIAIDTGDTTRTAADGLWRNDVRGPRPVALVRGFMHYVNQKP